MTITFRSPSDQLETSQAVAQNP